MEEMMGYDIDLNGSFTITPPLDLNQQAYLQKFKETRRMQRNADMTAERPDPVRESVGLPIGEEGGYFVGAGEYMGYEDYVQAGTNIELGILDRNRPPSGQPSLWCQWTVTDNGTAIGLNNEKDVRNPVEWIEYIVKHFLKPWGRSITGEVEWCGEDLDDCGTIHAKNNRIKALSHAPHV